MTRLVSASIGSCQERPRGFDTDLIQRVAGTEQGTVAPVTVTRHCLCVLQTLVGIQPYVTEAFGWEQQLGDAAYIAVTL